jgi:putative inorganic carbon (hco3(-)) transporter
VTFGRLSLSGVERLLVPIFAVVAALVVAREAVLAPKNAVGLGLGLVLVAVSVWRLVAGVAIFTVLTFPAHLPGSLDAGQTLAKPLGVVLVISWLLALSDGRARIPLLFRDEPFLSVVVIAFTVWAAASVIWARDSGVAIGDGSRLIQVVLLMVVSYSAVRTTEDLNILSWSFLIGAALTASYSLITGSYGHGGRLSGIFDPNFFAAELVGAVLLAGFMLTIPRGTWPRMLLFAFLGVYAVAFVLTESRGGLIGLGAGFAGAIVFGGPVRARVTASVLVVSAVAVVYYAQIAPDHIRARITDISTQSSAGRTDQWQIALKMASDRPLSGVGIGNFKVAEAGYTTRNINLVRSDFALGTLGYQQETHNTYLNLLSELGVIGLFLFIAVLALVFAATLRGVRGMRHIGDVRGELLARGLIGGTIGTLVAYIFLSAQYEKQLWLLFGLLAAIGTLGRRRAEIEAQS